jgi:hypothetical protein
MVLFQIVIPNPGWDVSFSLYFYGHFDFVMLTISCVLVGHNDHTPSAPVTLKSPIDVFVRDVRGCIPSSDQCGCCCAFFE